MRIIQVVNVRWYNATAWYGLFLSRLLKEAGHKVLVLCLPDTDPVRQAARWQLPVQEMVLNTQTPSGIIRLYHQLDGLVKRFQPDVVNCHRGESFFLWGLLRKKHSFTLVRTRGDQRLPRANWPNRWLHKNSADAVISTNSRMTRHFQDMFGLRHNLYQVLGGVDTSRFRFLEEEGQTLRKHYGFTKDQTVFGLVGRFDPVKGHRQVLEAAARLFSQGQKNFRLLFTGAKAGYNADEVRTWAKAAGIGEIVVCSDWVEDISAFISSFDVGLVASQGSETIARAALEIMACGRPLIGSSVGVMPDLLSPDAMFEPTDIDALSRLMGRCLSDTAFWDSLRAQQSAVMANLNEQSFVQATLDIYCKACSYSVPNMSKKEGIRRSLRRDRYRTCHRRAYA